MDFSPAVEPLETLVIESRFDRCAASFARPEGPSWKSGVVVLGEPDDPHLTTVCHDLARRGHAAIALQVDLTLLTEQVILTPKGIARLAECTIAVAAALEVLRFKAPAPLARYGAVGFGVGGLVSLSAGYRCQIGASVSVYADGPMRLCANLSKIFDRPKPQAAPLLCLLGALEEVLPSDLAALRRHLGHFGMRDTVVVYPRRNTGFCHPASAAYREAEAADAWVRLLHALETAPRQRHRFFSKSSLV